MIKAMYKPNSTEIGLLMAVLQHPGYEVLQKIYLSEIDHFQVDLMNVDPSSETYDKDVRIKHNLALAAGMFHQRVVNRVANEIHEFSNRKTENQIQPDVTEELIG